jgi:hypothetical protein
MNDKIAAEIQAEQNHGRQKYGSGSNDFAHDDGNSNALWALCISDHNNRARESTPRDRRQHLLKVAGLAVSAIEAIDRKKI